MLLLFESYLLHHTTILTKYDFPVKAPQSYKAGQFNTGHKIASRISWPLLYHFLHHKQLMKNNKITKRNF